MPPNRKPFRKNHQIKQINKITTSNRFNNSKKSQIQYIPNSKPIIPKKSLSSSNSTSNLNSIFSSPFSTLTNNNNHNNYNNNSQKTLKQINLYKHKNKVLLEKLDEIVNDIFPLSGMNIDDDKNINQNLIIKDKGDKDNNKVEQVYRQGNDDNFIDEEDIVINQLSKFGIKEDL
ncbi:hypothetical protein Glove_340g29 [Diversispora epigaea]|uniref:Uncharacterized protein n=1 Tax=Diversispora epigaea TaxID=1348612 RepID=A0A397HH35_9GLOM|nr:hypothetical protein Glove_340g29 [Diversispora epigaea]